MTAPNLEQIIAEHAARYDEDLTDWLACSCGEWRIDSEQLDYSGDADRQADRAHAAHVVAAIRDSGYTVIALPESDGPDEDGQLWFDDSDIRVDTTGKPDDTRLYVNGEPRTPDAVYRHAAALIAAAQHAGDTQ